MIPQREAVANPGQIRQKNEKVILDAALQEFSAHGYKGATIKKIADRAGLPKANIHYYFKSKLELYGAVLSDIIETTNAAFGQIKSDDDPAQALVRYVRVRMEFAKNSPQASRIFASEIISGAPYLGAYLQQDLRQWVNDKVNVLSDWINQGKMGNIDPYHIIFLIWGSTQFYADSAVQAQSVLGKTRLDNLDFVKATHSLIKMILNGCGIEVSSDLALGMKQELADAEKAFEQEISVAVEFALSASEQMPAKTPVVSESSSNEVNFGEGISQEAG